MNVIKFPGRWKAPDQAEAHDPPTPSHSHTHPHGYGQETAYTSELESEYADYGAERPYPSPPNSRNGKPVQKPKKTLSPAAIIARSLGPPGSFHNPASQPPRTPVEVIAGSLNPAGLGSTEELLRHSFWQVWLKHHEYLRKKSLYFLDSHREDAEDALSATMLKAFHSFVETSGGVVNTQAWLTTILYNACMDGHRSAKRRKDLFMETETAEFENLPSESGRQAQSPEDIVRIRESLQELYRLILELPVALRKPLLLRTVEHLSYPEIAQRLGITEANARKRVQQARDQLRASRLRDSLAELLGISPTNF
jgi:RNA polymerase sigma factor (sigma-70 family)